MDGPSLNSVLSTLKACVISNPDGVDEDRLNTEFRQLMGCNIPWQKLGFSSLKDLVKSSPNLQVITRGSRRIVVAETKTVSHLTAMISSQKKTSSKKKSRINRFIQRKVTSKPPPRESVKSGSLMKQQPVINMKRPPAPKTINHHINARPAGDSSSSGSSSPTFYSSPPKSQPSKPPIKPQSDLPLKEVNKKVQPQPTLTKKDKPQIKKGTQPVEKKIQELPIKKKPLLETPKEPSKVILTPPVLVNKPRAPLLPTPPIPPQNLYGVFQPPDVIPQTVYYSIPPVSLQGSFIPDNLVAPKPMKPSSTLSSYGSKRKNLVIGKLKSIKDNSAPSEDSLTAKFINLIKSQEWPDPEYRVLPRKENKYEVYGCTVRGSYSLNNNETLSYDYSTIPDEYLDINDSKEAVSLKAFQDMTNKIKEAASYLPVTSDTSTMITRIQEIVSHFPSGVWAYKIESDYKNKYGESLPSKWVAIVNQCDYLHAEKLADFSHVIRAVTKKTTSPAAEMPLGKLEFPNTETWDIYITKIVSSCEVWFRFVGNNYSDWLDEMTQDMCDHYANWPNFICPNPKVGGVYIYPSEYGAVRVEVLSLDNPTTATVIHIDHGDIEQVPKCNLCVLDNKFRQLPPQAVSCMLHDLEEFEGNKLCKAFLIDKVEGMVLVAEIAHTDPLRLILFDTSMDEPVNMNQATLNIIKSQIATPPSFSQDVLVQEGIVTSIWRTGEIYLQLPNEGLSQLTDHLNSISDVPPDHYLITAEEVMPDFLYIIEINNSWFRATVLPPARPIRNMIELLLVDTGNIRTCDFTKLIPLSLLSQVLCEIPKQALRVKLSGVHMYEDTAERIESLIPPPCSAIVKVTHLVDQSPEIELYIRESKGLISINSTLQLEAKLSDHIQRISLDNCNNEYVTIPPAPIPDCDKEFFDIYVVSVSNPTNLIVIPRKYINELTKLQNRLQEFYLNVDPSLHRLRNFSVGQACAIQHTDGQWYRGLIEQVVDRSMSQLLIRFCDFGNFGMISSDRLLSLDSKFLSLPAVGFNASIAGIQAISGDWDIADCIRAQKLMLEKNLVTIIKEKSQEGSQVFLKLHIFDTSGDFDCDIGKLLVDESRAKFKY